MRSLLNCKGQSIIEITLITPLILVALYVPFDFGMTMFTGHYTQIAVRDGARIAATTDLMDNTKAGNLATQVYGNLPQLLVSGSTTKQVRVRYYGSGGLVTCAQYVEVRAQGTYNFFLYRLIALLGFSAPSGTSITRTTQMRYEFQPDSNSLPGCTTITASGTH